MAIWEHIDEFTAIGAGDAGARQTVTPLPKGNRFHAHELPDQVLRELKPHASDWRKLDTTQSRNLGDNPNFKFFSFSHGKWTAVRDAQTASRGEQSLAFVRVTPVRAGGGGGGGGGGTATAGSTLTRAELQDLIAYSEAMAAQEKAATPVKMPEYRKLTVIVLPGNPEAPKPVRFSISGTQGAKQVWGSSGTKRESYTFERIPVDGTISLTASAKGQSQALVAATSHGNVMDTNRYQFPNDGNGPLLYVLNHELQGTTPVITVSTEPPQLGIFFDGTGNNMSNDLADPHDDKAPTNVMKLYELYRRVSNGVIDVQYFKGIGTVSGGPDDNLDLGIAHTFGVSILEAKDYVDIFSQNFKLAKIVYIDVFGFSRGAAQARAFINEIVRVSNNDPNYWGGPQIKFRFLGLFDTVGSVGKPGNNDNDNWLANSGLSGPISLDVHPSAVEHAVHLTAYDEKREYFPLSSLQTGKNQMPSNFIEEVWPGAHADIGGGYAYGEDKVYFPYEEKMVVGSLARKEIQTIEARLKTKYEAENPGVSIEVEVHSTRDPQQTESLIKYAFFPVWKRDIQPQLSHVTLARMHELALQYQVPLEPMDRLRLKSLEYYIPVDLQTWVAQDKNEGFAGMAHFQLQQHYIHHSDQYGHKPDSKLHLPNPHKMEKQPKVTAPNGIREMFYNEIDKAVAPSEQGNSLYPINRNRDSGQISTTKGRY